MKAGKTRRQRWINEGLAREEGGRKMDRDYRDSRTEWMDSEEETFRS